MHNRDLLPDDRLVREGSGRSTMQGENRRKTLSSSALVGERDYAMFRQEARIMIAEKSEQMKTAEMVALLND